MGRNILNKNTSSAMEASAGTGKTFQLAVRVTAMLMTGVAPSDILCLTFTKKATAEMKERIIKNINDLSENKAGSGEKEYIKNIMEEYAKYTGEDYSNIDDYIMEKAKSARDRLFNSFSELNVRTIDSFNNSILKIFPYEAGLRPDFKTQNDDVNQDIFYDAFNDIFAEIIENDDWSEILLKIDDSFEISPNSFLDELNRYAKMTAEKIIELENAVKNKVSVKELHSMVNKISKIRDKIYDNAEKYADSFTGELQKRQLNIINKIKDANKIKDLLGISIICGSPDEHSFFKNYQFSNTTLNLYDKIFEYIGQYLILKGEIIRNISLILGSMLYEKSRAVKTHENLVTYQDLGTITYLMFKKESIDKDYLYFRLDSRINHILIDEFQDTSLTQWLIVKPLAEEAMAGIGQKDKAGSFFYVGDPKQNIYRFRGGSSQLFRQVYKNNEKYLKYVTLDVNYRSGSNIVEFVNQISQKFYKDNKNLLEIYNINQKSVEKNGKGYVEIVKNKEDEVFVYESVKKIIENGWNYKDIAVLTTKNDTGTKIAEVLEKENIPVKVETSLRLSDTNVFNAIMSLAEYIEKNEEFAFLKFILIYPQAFDPALNEDNSIVNKYKNNILSTVKDMSAEPIFAKLLKLIEQLDLQSRFNNSPDFYSVIDVMAETAPNEYNIAKFIEDVTLSATDKPSISVQMQNAVTIMTIHKSKGLQFPAVILPNIKNDIKLKSGLDSKLFISNPADIENCNISYIYNNSEKVFIQDHDVMDDMEEENKRIFQDSVNVLYVALTRAESALFINLEEPKNEPLNISHIMYQYTLDMDEVKGSLKPKVKENKVEEKSVSFNIDLNKIDISQIYNAQKSGADNYHSVLFGTAVHNALFVLDYNNKNSIDTALNHTYSRYKAMLTDNDMESIKYYINEIYKNNTWQNMFKGRVFKERKGLYNNGLYSIDIYSILSDDHIILADYKTGNIDSKLAGYTQQMDTYEKILKEWYNCKNIDKIIFNLYDNKINVINI